MAGFLAVGTTVTVAVTEVALASFVQPPTPLALGPFEYARRVIVYVLVACGSAGRGSTGLTVLDTAVVPLKVLAATHPVAPWVGAAVPPVPV
jgi:hypothetical protein